MNEESLRSAIKIVLRNFETMDFIAANPGQKQERVLGGDLEIRYCQTIQDRPVGAKLNMAKVIVNKAVL